MSPMFMAGIYWRYARAPRRRQRAPEEVILAHVRADVAESLSFCSSSMRRAVAEPERYAAQERQAKQLSPQRVRTSRATRRC